MTITTVLKSLVASFAAAALVFALTGCFPWADRECKPHGGLDHMAKVGNSYFGVCKDGKWVAP